MIKIAVVLLGMILVFSSMTYSYADDHMAPSPKHQMNDGVMPEDVQCNVGLQLMIKYNGDAACVKPSSATRLAAADWGTIEGDVVTELPSHENEMELEEELNMDDNESDNEDSETESHKIELRESMDMSSG